MNIREGSGERGREGTGGESRAERPIREGADWVWVAVSSIRERELGGKEMVVFS